MRKTRFVALCLATVVSLFVFTSFANAQDDQSWTPKFSVWSTNPVLSTDDGTQIHILNSGPKTACAITWAANPETGHCIGSFAVNKIPPKAYSIQTVPQLFAATGVTDSSAYFNMTFVNAIETQPLANVIGGTSAPPEIKCPDASNPFGLYLRADGEVANPSIIEKVQNRMSVVEKYYPLGSSAPPTGGFEVIKTRYTLDQVNDALKFGPEKF